MITIKVPATTANMGAGFDCLGLALNLHNEIVIEPIEEGLEIVLRDEDIGRIASDSRNLIFRSVERMLQAGGYRVPGMRISQTNAIPLTRGLGSSAACVAAGVAAANAITGNRIPLEEQIAIATELEGHPDNVVPALLGGMTVSTMQGKQVIYTRITPPESLRCCAFIPEFSLSTRKARAVLPEKVSLSDAVFNVSRSALIVAAIMQDNLALLRDAIDDRLHQPYRKALIPNFDEILDKARELGALGSCLSGAGPTLIAYLDRDYEAFCSAMQSMLSGLDGGWQAKLLHVCNEPLAIQGSWQ